MQHFKQPSGADSGGPRVRPTRVVVDREIKQVSIGWNDGHESLYSFERLRAACPCAECRAMKSSDTALRTALVVSTGLESAQLVGNYAIQLLWDDGHRFGIFTWDYLRSIG